MARQIFSLRQQQQLQTAVQGMAQMTLVAQQMVRDNQFRFNLKAIIPTPMYK